MAYAPGETIRKGIQRYTETRATCWRHIMIDQHYPMRRNETLAAIKDVCHEYGIQYVNPGLNLGYHGGLNYALRFFGPEMAPEDALLVYDPDCWPESYGWDQALWNAMNLMSNIATCGILNPRSRKEVQGRPHIELGEGVWKIDRATVASLQAWRKRFVLSAGGFTEPNEYYGGIEAAMWPHLEALNMDWAVLTDYNDSEKLRDAKDPEYRAWQWMHGHRGSYRGDFAQFLQDGCPADGMPAFLP